MKDTLAILSAPFDEPRTGPEFYSVHSPAPTPDPPSSTPSGPPPGPIRVQHLSPTQQPGAPPSSSHESENTWTRTRQEQLNREQEYQRRRAQEQARSSQGNTGKTDAQNEFAKRQAEARLKATREQQARGAQQKQQQASSKPSPSSPRSTNRGNTMVCDSALHGVLIAAGTKDWRDARGKAQLAVGKLLKGNVLGATFALPATIKGITNVHTAVGQSGTGHPITPWVPYCPECVKKAPYKTGHFGTQLPSPAIGQQWTAFVRVTSQFCSDVQLIFSSNDVTLT
eukprot:SAG31_NODE_4416_length_3252_cov_5.682207_4_plen_283_part_00